MSSQVATIEQTPAAALGRRSALSGAWLLTAAMIVSGVLTYAFQILAAQTLGPHAYGQIAVLWGAVFIVAIVLFRPLEQTTSRTVADRLARSEEVRTVLRSVGLIAATVLLGLGVASIAFWSLITDRLFLGNDLMTAMLVAGIVAYALQYLVRGILGGVRWFGGYGLGLLADGAVRLAVAAPLLVVASQSLAAFAIVAAGVAGAAIPLVVGRRHLHRLSGGSGGPSFHVASALGFAAPAAVIAGADQLLVNGAPLLVVIGGGAGASAAAGVVFAATMLVRAPVYVFQGLAAALLPNLTDLHARDERAAVGRAVIRVSLMLLAGGALIALFAWTVGPAAMRLVYGDGFEAGRVDLALLGAAVGFYLAAGTISQALLALAAVWRAALAWLAAAALFIGLYAVLPGEALHRISVAFAGAMLLGLGLLAVTLVVSMRRE